MHITKQLYCEKFNRVQKSYHFLGRGHNYIARNYIIVHKKVVPSLLIKKQTVLQESSNENNYYHEQEGEYAA